MLPSPVPPLLNPTPIIQPKFYGRGRITGVPLYVKVTLNEAFCDENEMIFLYILQYSDSTERE